MQRLRRPSVVARALVQHAAISLVALIAVGTLAAIICVQVVQDQALHRAEANGESIAVDVVAPMVTPGVEEGDTDSLVALNRQVRFRMAGDDTIQRIKVWSPDGMILYCDDPRQIGLHFPLDEDDLNALNSGGVDSDISDLDKSENVYDRERGFGESLEVYVGGRDTVGKKILVETYFTANRLHADEASLIRTHRARGARGRPGPRAAAGAVGVHACSPGVPLRAGAPGHDPARGRGVVGRAAPGRR